MLARAEPNNRMLPGSGTERPPPEGSVMVSPETICILLLSPPRTRPSNLVFTIDIEPFGSRKSASVMFAGCAALPLLFTSSVGPPDKVVLLPPYRLKSTWSGVRPVTRVAVELTAQVLQQYVAVELGARIEIKNHAGTSVSL